MPVFVPVKEWLADREEEAKRRLDQTVAGVQQAGQQIVQTGQDTIDAAAQEAQRKKEEFAQSLLQEQMDRIRQEAEEAMRSFRPQATEAPEAPEAAEAPPEPAVPPAAPPVTPTPEPPVASQGPIIERNTAPPPQSTPEPPPIPAPAPEPPPQFRVPGTGAGTDGAAKPPNPQEWVGGLGQGIGDRFSDLGAFAQGVRGDLRKGADAAVAADTALDAALAERDAADRAQPPSPLDQAPGPSAMTADTLPNPVEFPTRVAKNYLEGLGKSAEDLTDPEERLRAAAAATEIAPEVMNPSLTIARLAADGKYRDEFAQKDIPAAGQVFKTVGDIGNVTPLPGEQVENVAASAVMEGLRDAPVPEVAKAGLAMLAGTGIPTAVGKRFVVPGAKKVGGAVADVARDLNANQMGILGSNAASIPSEPGYRHMGMSEDFLKQLDRDGRPLLSGVPVEQDAVMAATQTPSSEQGIRSAVVRVREDLTHTGDYGTFTSRDLTADDLEVRGDDGQWHPLKGFTKRWDYGIPTREMGGRSEDDYPLRASDLPRPTPPPPTWITGKGLTPDEIAERATRRRDWATESGIDTSDLTDDDIAQMPNEDWMRETGRRRNQPPSEPEPELPQSYLEEQLSPEEATNRYRTPENEARGRQRRQFWVENGGTADELGHLDDHTLGAISESDWIDAIGPRREPPETPSSGLDNGGWVANEDNPTWQRGMQRKEALNDLGVPREEWEHTNPIELGKLTDEEFEAEYADLFPWADAPKVSDAEPEMPSSYTRGSDPELDASLDRLGGAVSGNNDITLGGVRRDQAIRDGFGDEDLAGLKDAEIGRMSDAEWVAWQDAKEKEIADHFDRGGTLEEWIGPPSDQRRRGLEGTKPIEPHELRPEGPPPPEGPVRQPPGVPFHPYEGDSPSGPDVSGPLGLGPERANLVSARDGALGALRGLGFNPAETAGEAAFDLGAGTAGGVVGYATAPEGSSTEDRLKRAAGGAALAAGLGPRGRGLRQALPDGIPHNLADFLRDEAGELRITPGGEPRGPGRPRTRSQADLDALPAERPPQDLGGKILAPGDYPETLVGEEIRQIGKLVGGKITQIRDLARDMPPSPIRDELERQARELQGDFMRQIRGKASKYEQDRARLIGVLEDQGTYTPGAREPALPTRGPSGADPEAVQPAGRAPRTGGDEGDLTDEGVTVTETPEEAARRRRLRQRALEEQAGADTGTPPAETPQARPPARDMARAEQQATEPLPLTPEEEEAAAVARAARGEGPEEPGSRAAQAPPATPRVTSGSAEERARAAAAAKRQREVETAREPVPLPEDEAAAAQAAQDAAAAPQKVGLGDWVQQARYSGLLSNAAGIMADLITGVLENTYRLGRNTLQETAGAVTGRGGKPAASMAEATAGARALAQIPKAVWEQLSAPLDTGVGNSITKTLLAEVATPATGRSEVGRDLVKRLRANNQKGEKLAVGLEMPSRFRAAIDAATNKVAYEMALARQAYHANPGKAGAADRARWLENPPAEAVKRAQDTADHATYRNDPGALGNLLSNAGHHPVGNFIMPMVRTNFNIVQRGLERSPLGVIGMGADVVRGKGSLAERIKNVPRGAERSTDAAIGSAMWFVLAGLAEQGVITGSGPTDKRTRDVMMAQGWRPHAVKVGDTYYRYDKLGPFAFPLALAGAWGDAQRFKQEGVDGLDPEVLLDVAENALYWGRDQTFLRSFGDLYETLGDLGTELPRWAVNQAAGYGGPITGGFGTAIGSAFDPYERETTVSGDPGATFWNELKFRAPLGIMRQDVPQKYDVLGGEVRNPGYGFGFLNPARPGPSEGDLDPTVSTLRRYEGSESAEQDYKINQAILAVEDAKKGAGPPPTPEEEQIYRDFRTHENRQYDKRLKEAREAALERSMAVR